MLYDVFALKKRSGAVEASLVAAAWAAARLVWPPSGYNTHAIMYPVVEAAGGYNTLEPFHSLYPPLVALTRQCWERGRFAGPALPALQAVSLIAGAANLVLLHRAARRATGSLDAALGAALIGAVSANLWAWSLMTTSYTLATACLLAAAGRLLDRERLDPQDAAWTGLWVGLAAGFDAAAACAALPAAYELARRRAPHARTAIQWAAFGGAFAAPAAIGLAVLARRLARMGWPFPPTPTGFIESLPGDIVPLWQSWDLTGQIRAWAVSQAPLDLPLWAAAAGILAAGAAAKNWSERALWRQGAAIWSLTSLFFFLNDPHNRFVYSGGLLLPAMFAAWAARRGRPLAWSAAAALVLGVWHAVVPPQYFADHEIAGFAEARFLGGSLRAGDLLVALAEPDWTFSYAFARRARVVRVGRPGEEADRFGMEAASGDELERKIDAVLCAGGQAVFAADAQFRPSQLEPAALDEEARVLFRRFSLRYRVVPAWISPGGQRYFPLRPRRCA